MNRFSFVTPGLALIWAGMVIGGSMIAAPAKFQAPSLTLPVALEVGRAQFFWLGIGEGLLCAIFVLSMLLLGGVNRWLAAVPVLLLLVQRFAVMPPLDARTLQVIAGEAVGESQLHLLFVVLEVVKILVLLAIGVIGLRIAKRQG